MKFEIKVVPIIHDCKWSLYYGKDRTFLVHTLSAGEHPLKHMKKSFEGLKTIIHEGTPLTVITNKHVIYQIFSCFVHRDGDERVFPELEEINLKRDGLSAIPKDHLPFLYRGIGERLYQFRCDSLDELFHTHPIDWWKIIDDLNFDHSPMMFRLALGTSRDIFRASDFLEHLAGKQEFTEWAKEKEYEYKDVIAKFRSDDRWKASEN